ncbi:MAG: hypothetical protein CMM52_13240 [Rhodospirillaceae bacterium]|nr:hypothetical protein [Rhodospirillaceae bacterium]
MWRIKICKNCAKNSFKQGTNFIVVNQKVKIKGTAKWPSRLMNWVVANTSPRCNVDLLTHVQDIPDWIDAIKIAMIGAGIGS